MEHEKKSLIVEGVANPPIVVFMTKALTGWSKKDRRQHMSRMRAIHRKKCLERRRQGTIGCKHATPDMCQKCVSLFEKLEKNEILTPSSSGSWFLSDYKLKLFKKTQPKKYGF